MEMHLSVVKYKTRSVRALQSILLSDIAYAF